MTLSVGHLNGRTVKESPSDVPMVRQPDIGVSFVVVTVPLGCVAIYDLKVSDFTPSKNVTVAGSGA